MEMVLDYYDDKDYYYYRYLENEVKADHKYFGSMGLLMADGGEYLGVCYIGGNADDIPTELEFLVQIWEGFKRFSKGE